MPDTYTNPVFDQDFPDPFVLRFNGRYYAYGTGPAPDGKVLRVMASVDLVEWTFHGGVLAPLELEGAEEYWAPEVAYHEGTFYLYYATGRTDDPDHHLRVATAEHPLGPWRDRGVNLTPHEIFAIDAHPFRDPVDGQWYLFYANDVMRGPYAGTGIVVDRLLTMERLEGQPRPVLRPYAGWQVFELQRAVKQGLDWYTIEGPFVGRRDGRYVCLYSGGRWENPNYGVGWADANSPLGPWKDEEHEPGPSVLKTVPGKVVGPGHNSLIIGPDLETEYIVYHGWDPEGTARYPRIDVLTWDGIRPRCHGPTSTAQPRPRLPEQLFWSVPESGWDVAGEWQTDSLRPRGSGSRLRFGELLGDFTAEVSVRCEPGTAWSVDLGDLPMTVRERHLLVGTARAATGHDHCEGAFHTLTLCRRGESLAVALGEFPCLLVKVPAGELPLSFGGGAGATFGHLALARG